KADGKEWIRFTLPDEKLPHTLFELPISRWASIRSTDGSLEKRAVVEMTFCIANQLVTDEVNLAPRPNFIYPVLLGRNMLAGRFLIDSARDETTSPQCQATTPIPPITAPAMPAAPAAATDIPAADTTVAAPLPAAPAAPAIPP